MYRIDDIPIGRENAISRKQLAIIWGVPDRQVRKYIADLRTIDDGTDYAIISHSRFNGYYRSNDPEEIGGFIAEMEARIKNIVKAIKTAKAIRERLKLDKQHGGRLGG